MKFICQKDLLGFKEGLTYQISLYDGYLEVYLKESSTIYYKNLVIPCPAELKDKVVKDTITSLRELGLLNNFLENESN